MSPIQRFFDLWDRQLLFGLYVDDLDSAVTQYKEKVGNVVSITAAIRFDQQEWLGGFAQVEGVGSYCWYPDDWQSVYMTLAKESMP